MRLLGEVAVVVSHFAVQTVLEDCEGCIGISHTVDGLSESQIDGGNAIDGDVGTLELTVNGKRGVVDGDTVECHVAANVAEA